MIDSAFSQGELVHPLVGAPNSVDLYQAMARIAGGGLTGDASRTRPVEELVGHHDHYLFVLVDGLGLSLAPRFPAGGFLASAARHELRSVFPSTTAVALTSLATGVWPAEHGLTGWFTYFPEHRRVLAPLLFRERGTDIDARELGLALPDIVRSASMFGSFFRTVTSVLPREICDGAYASWSRGGTPIAPYRSFAHATRLLRRHYRRVTGPTYTYLYVLTVDKLSHIHGVASDEVTTEVARVDRFLGRVRETLPPSVRMLVTADHGLVDVPKERHFVFRDGDPLASHLLAGQTGEASTPVFHVRDGRVDDFREAFSRHEAARWFRLYTPDELADLGLYGPGALSEAMRLHLGDLVGIANEPSLLEYVPAGKSPVPHVGVHGGLRPGEIRVPLLLA
ncbi:MAG: alkaline phosphatase family protein [Spirochaetota bacterium]